MSFSNGRIINQINLVVNCGKNTLNCVMAFEGEPTDKSVLLNVSSNTLNLIAAGLAKTLRQYSDVVVSEPPFGMPGDWQKIANVRPDAVISEPDPLSLDGLFSLGVPVVLVPCEMLGEGVGCVAFDEEEIGRVAARHIKEQGYLNAAFLGAERESVDAGKFEGFRDELESLGVRMTKSSVRWEQQAGKRANLVRAVNRWLDDLPKPSCIFVSQQRRAVELVAALRGLGWEIPAQIGIITTEVSSDICVLSRPSLTAVRAPWEDLGVAAGKLAIKLLSGERPPSDCIRVGSGSVIARESTSVKAPPTSLFDRAEQVMLSSTADCSIESICEALGVGRRTLERSFAEACGHSPKQHLTNLKVERAKKIIERAPEMRIFEVAFRSGFKSPDRLAHYFFLKCNETPSSFRSRVRCRAKSGE